MAYHIVFERGEVISKRDLTLKEIEKISEVLGEYVDEYHFRYKE